MSVELISVSGGKDSTALYLWAIDKFGPQGFQAIFADTGNEHPVTINYVKNLHIMASGPVVNIVSRTSNPFEDMLLKKKRAPSSQAQFCTEYVKMKPIRDYCIQEGNDFEMYIGIRAGESVRRSKMKEREFSDYYDCFVNRPLLNWQVEDVWSILQKHGVPPNPLYLAGNRRVGCYPCIHASKHELGVMEQWAWEKVERWEALLGRSFFSPGKIPHIKIPMAHHVRAWATNGESDGQYALFDLDIKDVPSCMSTWGVCE